MYPCLSGLACAGSVTRYVRDSARSAWRIGRPVCKRLARARRRWSRRDVRALFEPRSALRRRAGQEGQVSFGSKSASSRQIATRNENQGQQTPQKRLKMSACYSDTHAVRCSNENQAYASNSSLPLSPQPDPVHAQHSYVWRMCNARGKLGTRRTINNLPPTPASRRSSSGHKSPSTTYPRPRCSTRSFHTLMSTTIPNKHVRRQSSLVEAATMASCAWSNARRTRW